MALLRTAVAVIRGESFDVQQKDYWRGWVGTILLYLAITIAAVHFAGLQ
jgi:hypothetical protein